MNKMLDKSNMNQLGPSRLFARTELPPPAPSKDPSTLTDVKIDGGTTKLATLGSGEAEFVPQATVLAP